MSESEKPRRKVAGARSPIEAEIPESCREEGAAVAFLERMRWPNGAACPGCGSVSVYAMTDKDGGRSKRYLWRCREKECGRQFTVRIGTVFEESRIPLRIWLYAIFRACSSKKGISALQIKRECGLSYKSALFLMHRIRFAMSDPKGPLSGIVEADETYVGGKPRNKAMSVRMARREAQKLGPVPSDKTPVFAMVERGGQVRASVVPTVSSKNLREALLRHVRTDATIMTDESVVYPLAVLPFTGGHFTVNHHRSQYVGPMGETTNTVEGFFSLLKRKFYGTHHAVSPRHLGRYVDEAAFLYNTRKMDDGDRTIRAIRGAEGKRLRYREPAVS